MEDTTLTNVVQESRNYDEFTMLDANRDVLRGHVERLKDAIVENGNLTMVQPILVNEHKQIIDGQHRYTACKELGIPVFFTVFRGLNISDARIMNILQKNWTSIDYAKSYAHRNPVYRTYLNLTEDYNLPHSTVLAAISGNFNGSADGIMKKFREGDLTITDEVATNERLEHYRSILDITGFRGSRPLAYSVFQAMQHPSYDKDRMLRKLRENPTLLTPYSGTVDNLRMLEKIYNGTRGESSRIRFF